MKIYHFTAIVLILTFFSCNNKENPANKDLSLSSLCISDITEQISINLDMMFDSIYFLPLESNEKIVLNNSNDLLINDNHLVYIDGTSVLLFDNQGKFQKKILTRGRGPKEFISIRSPRLTDNGIYYSDGQYRNRICFYEFETESLNFISHDEGHISNLVVDANRMLHFILCSPIINDHFEAILYTQNTDGKVIRKHNFGQISKSQGILSFHRFFNRNNKTFVSSPRIDTIWEITDSTLFQIWTTDIGEPSNLDLNTQTYYNAELIEFSQSNLLFFLQQFDKNGKKNIGGNRELIFVNRKTHEVGKVSNFTIDDFKLSKDFVKIHTLSSNHMIIEINAYKFIEEINSQNISPSGKYSKKLLDLKKSMQEEDNSLLLVGKISDN